ncbi:MAG: ATP-binding protein [Alphaproteobacteria bacterium]|nr:ATP-binding protein [Alphaproteobacteria bacterium]
MKRFPDFIKSFFRTATYAGAGLCALQDTALAQSYGPEATTGDQMAILFFGLLIGVVLTAAAYLFFIWVAMRDRGQVFLLLFLLCIGAHIASTNDLLMNGIGIHSDSAREFITNLSLILSWILAQFFTYYFLELDTNSPQYKIFFMLISAALLSVLFYSLLDRGMVEFALPTIGTITIATLLVAGLTGVRNGTSGSLIHIIAFTCFLGGVMADPAYVLGYLASPEAAHNATYAAFALSTIMFAVVVASQFAARQDEKEKALAISNERFVLATRGANEGLFDWNLATGEVFFSDQFRKIIGMRIGNGGEGLKKWVRMMLPSDRRVVTDAVRRFRRNSKTNTLNVEYRIVHLNGERRWLHSKAVAMRDKNTQKVMRLVGSTSDITSRKQSEVDLRASEARFRSITEAHPVPVLIVSLGNGSILYATPGAEQLLGLRQEAMHMEYVERFLPDRDKRMLIWQGITSGQPVDLVEMEVVRGDGIRMPAAVSARRISYQNEDAMVMGLYDLTERKKAEAQIAQQQDALQQSEKMAALGGLLAGVAHELNNPLSVVVGQATLLMEGSPEPKVATRAEKIFKAADRCSRIVKSFLALARRKPPERKPVDLNLVVKSSLELLGYQLKTGEVDIQSHLDPALPEVTGDGDQLTQVITNLVLNLAQAMEGWAGPHRITVTSTGDAQRNVILTIADTGPGIPQEIRTRVFEPFFTTKGGKGTGVGLALCLNIVASHGGELLLTDTEGGGATFTIKFPAAESAAPEGSEVSTEDGHDFGKISLLLVDDEVEIAQTLADLMEPDGHEIDIAANGAIALDKLRKRKFDAIISDLRMPVMDGPALYEALQRELPSYLNRIIYVTGDTLSTHVHEFLSQHSVPVVEKPYRLKDIHRALSELLKNAAKTGT